MAALWGAISNTSLAVTTFLLRGSETIKVVYGFQFGQKNLLKTSMRRNTITVTSARGF